jgi:hypothetical protein
MTPQPTTGTVEPATATAGCSTASDRLHDVAAAVLNEHTNDNGCCVACAGVAFPCDLAVLAEHNVALLSS